MPSQPPVVIVENIVPGLVLSTGPRTQIVVPGSKAAGAQVVTNATRPVMVILMSGGPQGPAGSGGGGGGGAVESVNGKVGVVVLNAANVGADPAGAATTAAGSAESKAIANSTASDAEERERAKTAEKAAQEGAEAAATAKVKAERERAELAENQLLPSLPPVRAVSSANIASLSGTTTVDGQALIAGDRVLLVAQTTAAQNGPWIVEAGAWKRPTDFPHLGIVKGRTVAVQQGSTHKAAIYVLCTLSVEVDNTAQVWEQVQAAGGGGGGAVTSVNGRTGAVTVVSQSVNFNERAGITGKEGSTVDSAAALRTLANEVGTGIITFEPGTYFLKTAIEANPEPGRAVSGYEKPQVCLFQPVGVSLQAGGRNVVTFQMDDTVLPAGAFGFYKEKGTSNKAMKDWWGFAVKTKLARVTAENELKTPPRNKVSAFLYRGSCNMVDVLTAGNFFASLVVSPDHSSWTDCDLDGWAKIVWTNESSRGGNNWFYNCALIGGYCMGFLEEGAGIAGTTFVGGHMGFHYGPYFWIPLGGGGSVMGGTEWKRTWFEGGARGFLIIEDMAGTVKKLKFRDCVGGSPDAPIQVGKVGDPTSPLDAYMKAGSIEEVDVQGKALMALGPEPETGACIKAFTCKNNNWGDGTVVLRQSRGIRLPVIRAIHAYNNWMTFEEEPGIVTKVFFAKLNEGSIGRGEIAQVAAGPSTLDKIGSVPFAKANGRVRGIALVRSNALEATQFSGNTVKGSPIITAVSSTAGLVVGEPLEKLPGAVEGPPVRSVIARIGPAPASGELPELSATEIESSIPINSTHSPMQLLGSPFTIWGTLTAGSVLVTNVSFLPPSLVSDVLKGVGVPINTIIEGVDPIARTITLSKPVIAGKGSSPDETVAEETIAAPGKATFKVKSTSKFVPGDVLLVGTNLLTVGKILSSTEFGQVTWGGTFSEVVKGTTVVQSQHAFTELTIEPQAIHVPYAVPDRKQPSILPLRTAKLGFANINGKSEWPTVEVQAAAAGAGTIVAEAGQTLLGMPPSGNLSIKTGTKTVTCKYAKRSATQFEGVTELAEAIGGKAEASIASWPPNKRGAETTLAAAFELGQGGAAPYTIHDSAIYILASQAKATHAGPVWPGTLSDLALGGGIAWSNKQLFQYRSTKNAFPFELKGISRPGAPASNLAKEAPGGTTELELENAASFPTASTKLTAAAASKATTLKMEAVGTWPSRGHLYVPSTGQTLKYTSKTATEFLGVGGLSVAIANGAEILLSTSITVGKDGTVSEYHSKSGNVLKLTGTLPATVAAGGLVLEVGPLPGGLGFKSPIYRAMQVASIEGFSSEGGVVELEYTAEAKTFKRLCMYAGIEEWNGLKYIVGVTCPGGPVAPIGTKVVDKECSAWLGSPVGFQQGPASIVAGESLMGYTTLVSRSEIVGSAESEAEEPSEEGGGAESGEAEGETTSKFFFLGLSHIPSAKPSVAVNGTGGTVLATEAAIGAATITVNSTQGFVSSGTLIAEGKAGLIQAIKYTGYTQGLTTGTFTGCTGITQAIEAGAPIGLFPGRQVAAGSQLRPRFATGAETPNDVGVVAEASGPYDPKGEVIGVALSADEGGIVMAEV